MNLSQALFLECIATFMIIWVSLRLLDVAVEVKRLLLFAIAHVLLTTLTHRVLNIPDSFTLYESLVYLLLALFLLRLPPVTALMSRAIGLSLVVFGKWVYHPDVLRVNANTASMLEVYVNIGWLATLIALVLLSFIYAWRLPFLVKKWKNQRDDVVDLEAVVFGLGSLLLASYYGYILLAIPAEGSWAFYRWIGLATLPPITIIYFRKIQTIAKDHALLHLQEDRLAIQENAIEAMREQRHEIINDLALISAYIQMGMDEKALDSIDFIAAELADQYNYAALPKDAWVTTINAKQQQASHLGVQLLTFIEAEPPADLNEQRLLPKVVANLLNNAFEAVRRRNRPQVVLIWKQVGEDRLLSVMNNGPAIPADELVKIFDYGYSSKPGYGKGWGLAICKRIAAELGGELSAKSTAEMTEFTLLLPAKSLEYEAQAAAAAEPANP